MTLWLDATLLDAIDQHRKAHVGRLTAAAGTALHLGEQRCLLVLFKWQGRGSSDLAVVTLRAQQPGNRQARCRRVETRRAGQALET